MVKNFLEDGLFAVKTNNTFPTSIPVLEGAHFITTFI